jgi:hypothetical protein
MHASFHRGPYIVLFLLALPWLPLIVFVWPFSFADSIEPAHHHTHPAD